VLVIVATWETEIRRILVQGQLRQIVLETPPPISKITRAKGIGGVAQVHEALSSSPRPTNKKMQYLAPFLVVTYTPCDDE
jgi:hypothetical protein